MKMKPIFDIFKKSKLEKKQKTEIIIDTREKSSLVVANLIEKKADIRFEYLEIADYLIRNTAIERKTFSDLISSMINKRLDRQLKELKKYKNHFLIIESFDFDYEKLRNKNAIKGLLLSIILDYKIPIIFTEDEEDTADFLILLAKKQEKNKHKNPLRQSRTLKTTGEQKQFILEGFPGIGPKTAERLLKNFPTLNKIFSATEDELRKINRFNEKKIKTFKELLEK